MYQANKIKNVGAYALSNAHSNALFTVLSKVNTLTKVLRAPLLVGLFAGVLTGCAALNPPSTQQPEKPVIQSALSEDAIRYDTTDARVAQYWSAAEQARLDQDIDAAIAHLISALEISPQNSILWSRAAELQLNKQQASLAESYAVKSNTFAGTNARLLHRNWLIIEHARSMRGDLLGVRSAHKKVQEFRYR